MLDIEKGPAENSVLWTMVWSGTPARAALGRGLALQLLARSAPGHWTVETADNGKPIARGNVQRHISISHTGSFVAAAVSSVGPIGIDIERSGKARDFTKLAKFAFGPEEAKVVALEGARAFYRIWTIREAISKAEGDGLPLVMDRTDRVPCEMADGQWTAGTDGWLVAHDTVRTDVSMALAILMPSREAARTLRLDRMVELEITLSAPSAR